MRAPRTRHRVTVFHGHEETLCGVGAQDGEAHLFVGVTIRQPQRDFAGGAPRLASLLVRRSVLPSLPGPGHPNGQGGTPGGSPADYDPFPLEGADNSGEWLPADAILEGPQASSPSADSVSGGLARKALSYCRMRIFLCLSPEAL